LIARERRRRVKFVMKDFLSVVKGRRSIRVFEDREVAEDLIKDAVEIARWAPSGANRQPFRFVIVREEEKKRRLCDAAKAKFFQINRHIYEAPVVIVVCSHRKASSWHIYDTSCATMLLLLALEYLGLSGCWVGLFDEEKVKEILDVPEGWDVIALVPVGYSKERPAPPPRIDPENLIFWESWKEKKTGFLKSGVPSVIGRAAKTYIKFAKSQIKG
jgi:nitroreductase